MTDRSRLRVVEVGSRTAGAVCGSMYAGFGHDVVLITTPTGETMRTWAPHDERGRSLAFVALDDGKRSEKLVAGAEGRRQLQELLDGADVLLVDAPKAEATELGLDAGELAQRAGLVVIWISGFGLDDDADLPADSLLAEAYGGLSTMIGETDQRPLALGGEQAAYATGVAGFLSAEVAVMRRNAGGEGDLIDLAMCDVTAYMDWKSDVTFSSAGIAPRRSGRNPGDWRLVKARDGWVGFIFQAWHWQQLVELIGSEQLGDPELAVEAVRKQRSEEWWPVIEAWAAEREAEQIYHEAQQHGLPFGWVVRSSDLAESEQLHQRGFIKDPEASTSGPVVSIPVGTDKLAATGSGSIGAGARQPLEGVVVLDFGTITAGAAVTRFLADFGATVIKVESTDHPDTFRSWKMPLQDDGTPALNSPYFASNNVGKLSVGINLKSDDGRRLAQQLARTAHVVVENYRVGVTRRLGIDAETLQAENPNLIYLSLSSQGQQGPESGNRSYGSTLDLLSGLASVTGYDAENPLWSSSDVNYPDQLVSLFGAAILVYCLERGLPGIHLDLSQREVVSWTLAAEIADYLLSGNDAVATGNRRPGRAPHDIYPCRELDTWVAISCASEGQRQALTDCLGLDEASGRDAGWWAAHQDEIDAGIAGWTQGRERAQAVLELRAAGVPAVPVLDAADRLAETRFVTRGVILDDGGLPVKGLPMRFQRYPVAPSLDAPELGADTRAVLSRFCGLTDDDLDQLVQHDAVFSVHDHSHISH
jgi:crotonobetainyl-CoA:carnitine CoA-transferase CaiB-like acyl-CoA transferase